MADFAYLEAACGEAGYLSSTMASCFDKNQNLTKFFDVLFSPDEVDSFDASCNTCMHFQRRGMTPIEKAERNIFGMPGRCQLKLIDVRGWQRGQYCGDQNGACYENRRTGRVPAMSLRQKAVI